MKKFQFSLEKVLTYKERLFDLARARHAEALRDLQIAESALHELREKYSQCLHDLSLQMKKNFHIRELGPYYRFMSFTKREIAEQSKVVCLAIEKEESKRQELMKAAQEKESLAKLKEKEFADYSYALNREEQDFLDEVSSHRYARTLRGNMNV
jgi:flagellar FliJ protein